MKALITSMIDVLKQCARFLASLGGPSAKRLLGRIRAVLKRAKDEGQDTTPRPCPQCHGTGLDTAHKWPDGSFASCERCEGVGFIQPEAGDE